MTAREVAHAYSPAAEWVPHDRRTPPPPEPVRVLYADGVVEVATHAGGAIYLLKDGTYRYVDPAFWQPLPEKGGVA